MDLRYGNADENVRKRSIRDVILHEGQRCENRPEEENILSGREKICKEIDFCFGTEISLLCPSRAGELAVTAAVNRLACGGIRAFVFSPVILLPPGTQEDLLREMMRQICRTAFSQKIKIGEAGVQVTDAVTRPVVIGTAAGERFCDPVSGQKDWDIILTGPVGMEGTYILVCEQFKMLQERFSMSILARLKDLSGELCVLRAAETAAQAAAEVSEAAEKKKKAGAGRTAHADQVRSVPVMVSLGEGGFFAGLWELSRKTGCGLDVDLQTVPLLQETIEITDYLGINPYAMRSAGSLLIAAADGEKILRRLQEEDRIAVRIGRLTAKKEKIIRNGEDVRYLDRPQTDTLALWRREKKEKRDTNGYFKTEDTDNH